MAIPGTEAALVAFKLTEALIDRLVEQEILTRDEMHEMLQKIVSELRGLTLFAAGPAADLIQNSMLNNYNKPRE